MDTIYSKLLLQDKIKLEPKSLHKKFRDDILKKLKEKVENKCSKHGYILKDSVVLYKVSTGCVDMFTINGYILFDVQRIINGGETNYITATLSIYLDLYNVFVNLLSILGIVGGDKD
jgi:DNA-directed RNA polymerase subunit E'/Rpb7